MLVDCSVLQCVAVCCSVLQLASARHTTYVGWLQRVVVCCTALQYVVVCCTARCCVAVRVSLFYDITHMLCFLLGLQRVAACCRALQRALLCCSQILSPLCPMRIGGIFSWAAFFFASFF